METSSFRINRRLIPIELCPVGGFSEGDEFQFSVPEAGKIVLEKV